jgi:hypothetical protein
MSRRVWGILVLFGLSMLLGVGAGEFFFGIWQKTVPPAMTTSFNTGSAHAAFLGSGAVVGVVFFLWGLLSPVIALMFRPKKVEPARP